MRPHYEELKDTKDEVCWKYKKEPFKTDRGYKVAEAAWEGPSKAYIFNNQKLYLSLVGNLVASPIIKRNGNSTKVTIKSNSSLISVCGQPPESVGCKGDPLQLSAHPRFNFQKSKRIRDAERLLAGYFKGKINRVDMENKLKKEKFEEFLPVLDLALSGYTNCTNRIFKEFTAEYKSDQGTLEFRGAIVVCPSGLSPI